MKTDFSIVKFQQYRSGDSRSIEGDLIVESPVDLYVNGQLWLTFMCTPNKLEALAVGFLYNEGVIDSLDQVVDIHVCENGDIIDIWLDQDTNKPKDWIRTSGCTGGYTSIELDSLNP